MPLRRRACRFIASVSGLGHPRCHFNPCLVVQRVRRAVASVRRLRERKKHQRARLSELLSKAHRLCDINGDGGVSLDECLLLESQLAELRGDPFDVGSAKRHFRRLDTNGDGGVSVKEYVDVKLRALPDTAVAHGAQADALQQLLPRVVALRRRRRECRAELIELFKQMFALCDVSGDGELDMEECVALDGEIAELRGRPSDPEISRAAWCVVVVGGGGHNLSVFAAVSCARGGASSRL
eukprot:SAG25_NODE_47_length_18954_cov_11.266295_10_plen_239_part_00